MGGQLACRQVTPGKLGCGLPLRGHRGPGPVRASVLLSRVLTEAGVTPAVHLRGPAPLAASPMPPVSESGRVLAELAVSSWAWGADTHARKICVVVDTLGHADAPAACIVLEGSGRAGPSVKEDACRREEQAHHRLDPSRCSQPAVYSQGAPPFTRNTTSRRPDSKWQGQQSSRHELSQRAVLARSRHQSCRPWFPSHT